MQRQPPPCGSPSWGGAGRISSANIQEREAASKFGAWIEFDEGNVTQPEVYFTNSGAQPIYDVTLYFDFPVYYLPDSSAWGVGDYDTDVYNAGTIGPRDPKKDSEASAFLTRKLSERVRASLGDYPDASSIPGLTYAEAAERRNEDLVSGCRPTISFRDSNGTKWARSDQGNLVTLPDTEWERLTEVKVPPSMANFLPGSRHRMHRRRS